MLLWNTILSLFQISVIASPAEKTTKLSSNHGKTAIKLHPLVVRKNITKKFDTKNIGTKLDLKKIGTKLVAFDRSKNYSTNQSDIQTQIKKLQQELGKLKTKISGKSMYCDFLPTDVCGQCSCINDARLPKKYYCDCRHLEPQQDCLEFLHNGYKTDGLYKITGDGYRAVDVSCDQTTDNGGWTVFQRRIDGTQSFHHDWQMYRVGFGDLQFEHWLGNEHLHKLLLHSLYYLGTELRVDMMDWNLKRKYAKYDQFQVDSEFAKYELHVGGYSGTAGNAMGIHNKLGFTTIDQDNDIAGGNCAQKYAGGWWYAGTSCVGGATLNHRYYQLGEAVPSWYGLVWTGINPATQSLKRTEMKFRRKI